MATVTALRAHGPDRVVVELDGAAWRTISIGVVARVGLAVGAQLDRAELRALRHELRRSEALARATRLLERRGASARRVDDTLARAGFATEEREETLDALTRVGYLDDERLAFSRAGVLASRRMGDNAIRADLERLGIVSEHAEAAIAGLPPEHERAYRILATRGHTPAAARYLARKGFSTDTLDAYFPWSD